jgi:RHS repeat-associated protein
MGLQKTSLRAASSISTMSKYKAALPRRRARDLLVTGLVQTLIALSVLSLSGHALAALTATPNPNNGDYTVGWSDVPGAEGYVLYESEDDGVTWGSSYYAPSGNKSFTGKPLGQYTYKLKYCITKTIRGEDFLNCALDAGYPYETVTVGGTPPPCASPPSDCAAPADTVGTTPYAIDVGTDGDAVISIPIEIIPGVGGFQPSLAIEYDSGRGIDRLEQSLPEDTIGYGWRLTGLSQIRRCVVDQPASNSINLSSSDSLCLDGMPLVLESGTHMAVGAKYRTLFESYTKIEVKGSTGAIWFEAKRPDGSVHEYGTSQAVNQGGVNYQWSLDRSTDPDNVVVDYTYHFDPVNGINYIVGIDYHGATVTFGYQVRTDADAVAIGSASQTQSVFLHTIKVRYNDKDVREYHLFDEVVATRRRLKSIQQCGYDETGSASKCLAPISFDWLTPSSTMAAVPILVDGMNDGLNNVHQIEYGTIDGSSPPFLFTERPFGNGSPPQDTQLLSGTGALRHVATKLRRDNGLGGFHDTTYAYQSKGLESTRHWGFLGFYAQRIKDEESGVVTYVQNRMDYPYFGQVARLQQFDAVYGSHTETLTRSETEFSKKCVSFAAGPCDFNNPATTVYPYASRSIDFVYEDSIQLGASQTSTALSIPASLITQAVRTAETGTSVNTGSSGTTWGDIPVYTVSDLENTTRSTVTFNNRTTYGQWLVGFPSSVVRESWPGAIVGPGIVQDLTMTPRYNSLRPGQITRFPNDADLNLTTTINYTTFAMLASVAVSGANVPWRSTNITSYSEFRYPAAIQKPLGLTTTVSAMDLRFGTPKIQGDPNGRNLEWARDEFGRLSSFENSDGVVTTTDYYDCPTGCGVSVYGISPSYFTETDSIVSPKRRTYFDSLGRPIRSELESFTGTAFSKQDTKYDTQGRIQKYSLPYFSGAPNDVVPTYDIRDRITNVARPDGSSTGTTYTVSGDRVVVTITDSVLQADGTSDGAQVKRNVYNILGQLKETTDGHGTSIDPVTTYTYDANGNVLTATVNGGVDGITTTTFTYDAAGNQKTITGPNIGTVTSTYTALNEIYTRTDAEGQVLTYDFDVLGRLEEIEVFDGSTYTYNTWDWDTAANGKGKLASRSNPGFSESYIYSAESRLDTVTTTITPIGGSPGTPYTTNHTYDTHGRPFTTTYPAGFTVTRAYNAQGYLSQLKDGANAVHTINDRDAFGYSVDETYGNGIDTLRTYDPETGRLTDIDTTLGGTVFQDNEYRWRSNGTLESRLANPAIGLSATREEVFTYDVLNRLEKAETFINSSNTRDLDYVYDLLGNIDSKTSTLSGDTDVSGYAYGAGNAGAHAVTSASIDGVSHTLTYDDNGAVTRYDIAGTSDDKYIAYNAFNQPTKIVVGSSLTDSTPVAKDEFAYGPNGQRYARRTTWQDGGNTYTEEVAYIGAVEVITDNSTGSSQTVIKTSLSTNAMHVKIVGATTETFFEYAHRDHLGSIEVVTDENGNVLDQLAIEPFGSRKAKDWASNIPTPELDALLDLAADHSRKARGFTGHEHLDRTGFIHMNGRVYDPVLGRFLSPDPIVQYPGISQSWNRYSYVGNTPTSFTDPTGFQEALPDFIAEPGDKGYNIVERPDSGGPWLNRQNPRNKPDPFVNEVSGGPLGPENWIRNPTASSLYTTAGKEFEDVYSRRFSNIMELDRKAAQMDPRRAALMQQEKEIQSLARASVSGRGHDFASAASTAILAQVAVVSGGGRLLGTKAAEKAGKAFVRDVVWRWGRVQRWVFEKRYLLGFSMELSGETSIAYVSSTAPLNSMIWNQARILYSAPQVVVPPVVIHATRTGIVLVAPK